MDDPTVEELLQMAQWLRHQIATLELSNDESPTPVSTDVIPAGTVFYCRPSKASQLIQRLGGPKKVQIVDTTATRGFCSSQAFTPEQWDYKIYPYNIGPSNREMLTDEIHRIPVRTNNDCITPTAWHPIKMFSGGTTLPSSMFCAECELTSRVLWLTTRQSLNAWSYLFNFRGDRVMDYGKLSPWFANPLIQTDNFRTDTRTILLHPNGFTVGDLMQPDLVTVPYDIDWPSDDRLWIDKQQLEECGWRDDELCVVQIDFNMNGGLLLNVETDATVIPQQVAIFKLNSNRILGAEPTERLRYGGYSRNGNGGTGPAPRWNRTNLIQIKTLVDVPIETGDSGEPAAVDGGSDPGP